MNNQEAQEFRKSDAGRDATVLLNERLRETLSRIDEEELNREFSIRLEERLIERARIARELHDGLFQGFLLASLLLHGIAAEMATDSPCRAPINRAVRIVEDALNDTRNALEGVRAPRPNPPSLEQAFSELRNELSLGQNALRVFVIGRPRALQPALQQQIYLIGREALLNAVRHSRAGKIEVEIEYRARELRMTVRDNGCGIDPQILEAGRDSHYGLLGMKERAGMIGANLRILSKLGAGTEIEVSVSSETLA